jgi:hypothetical protein
LVHLSIFYVPNQIFYVPNQIFYVPNQIFYVPKNPTALYLQGFQAPLKYY